MTDSLLVDDALGLLESTTTARPLTFFNGRNLETHASFAFPEQWDERKRHAIYDIVAFASKALAIKDPLYDKALGYARLQEDFTNDGQRNIAHYASQPGAIAPPLDKLKAFIDNDMRRELAKPDYWVRKKTKGTRYFIAEDQAKQPDYAGLIKSLSYLIGFGHPSYDANDMKIKAQGPNGAFTDRTVQDIPVAIVDIDSKPSVPLPPEKLPRQGIEITTRMAEYIMPLLGVDKRRIRGAPRELK